MVMGLVVDRNCMKMSVLSNEYNKHKNNCEFFERISSSSVLFFGHLNEILGEPYRILDSEDMPIRSQKLVPWNPYLVNTLC